MDGGIGYAVLEIGHHGERSSDEALHVGGAPAVEPAVILAQARIHAGQWVIIDEDPEATWARMAALGVDRAQGYLISRPLPAAAVQPWYREWCSRYQVLRG